MKTFLLTLLVLAILFFGIGFLLPSHYEVSRSILIAAPSGAIHSEIEDLHRWEEWMVWKEREPEMQIQWSGTDTGAGAIMTWEAESGVGRLEVTASDPKKGVWFDCLFDDTYALKGVVMYAEGSDGTTVTWTGRGELGNNPVSRYFGLLMDSFMGPDFEANLENIRQRVEG